MAMDVAAVAARTRTENFPVASLLFPREHRPHLRAIYGFARLVDILGDEEATGWPRSKSWKRSWTPVTAPASPSGRSCVS